MGRREIRRGRGSSPGKWPGSFRCHATLWIFRSISRKTIPAAREGGLPQTGRDSLDRRYLGRFWSCGNRHPGHENPPGQPRTYPPAVHSHHRIVWNRSLHPRKNSYLLKWDPGQKAEGLTHTMAFITGSSKTADIEATWSTAPMAPGNWLYSF